MNNPALLPAPQPAWPQAPQQPIDRIARHAAPEPLSYADLRDKGIALAQAASGQLWTDYNLHDPGVTLLEAWCYALTEDVFNARLPVADLLTAPDGRIHYEAHGLHAAPVVLPCRATTEQDYLRWIMDRVPQVLGLRMDMHETTPGLPSGLWRVSAQLPSPDTEQGLPGKAQLAARCARAYWAQRNLCEDLKMLPQILKPMPCRLSCDIEVQGPRDVTDILGELVTRCAEYIATRAVRLSLLERLPRYTDEHGIDTAALFDGPRLHNGWIDPDQLERHVRERLFVSDLARSLQDIEGLAEIRHLGLHASGQDGSDQALLWQSDDWALELQWPHSPDDLRDLQASRRGVPLTLSDSALLARLNDLRFMYSRVHGTDGLASTTNEPEQTHTQPEHPLAPPQGRAIEPTEYVSMHANLPPLYQALDSEMLRKQMRATGGERLQFLAYLAQLEQGLAHAQAQGGHLRDLYTLQDSPAQSYWWAMLGDAQLPGLSQLYRRPVEQVQHQVFEASDAALERRGRVLDHLLALHGEAVTQSSLRGFGVYYSPAEWEQHLYQLKLQMAQRIVRHTRDRHAGIDYSRPSYGVHDNTAPLQERISLLLGFAEHHSRPLTEELREQDIVLADAASPALNKAPSGELHALALWDDATSGLRGAPKLGRRVMLAQHIQQLAHDSVSPALLRCAAHAARYYSRREPSGHALWLGPSDEGHWWRLCVHRDLATLQQLAVQLHQFVCQLQRACEGLHLIEHILLRPVGWPTHVGAQPADAQAADAPRAADTAEPPPTFYTHQLTLVLPAWTTRCSDPAFQKLAQETVELSCPAHVQAHLLWLDADDLRQLEALYPAWLKAKQAHCEAVTSGALQAGAWLDRLEHRSRELRQWLWTRLRHTAAFAPPPDTEHEAAP